jgi:hypothetical protein
MEESGGAAEQHIRLNRFASGIVRRYDSGLPGKAGLYQPLTFRHVFWESLGNIDR